MDCGSCAAKIETAVRRIDGVDGVDDVTVSVSAGIMNVTHRGDASISSGITKAVTALGYTVAALPLRTTGDDTRANSGDHEHGDNHSHDHGAPHDGLWWKNPEAQLTLACGAAVVVATIVVKFLPASGSWAFVAAMAVGLLPIAQRAYQAARSGTPFSFEMLMTIAAIGAVLIGASEEAAAVVFLSLIGELLESVAAGRARASITSLTTLVPKMAQLEQGGITSEVPAESLVVGSIILVRPGDRLPADGELLCGESSIDEAPVTGESTPCVFCPMRGRRALLLASWPSGLDCRRRRSHFILPLWKRLGSSPRREGGGNSSMPFASADCARCSAF